MLASTAAAVFALLASSASPVARAQSVAPAASKTGVSGVSGILSPSYAGMGIEPSNLFSFTGANSSGNSFTNQLLSNLGAMTGIPPHIRVGGNSADQMKFDENFSGFTLENNPNPTGQGNGYSTDHFIFGPNYFTALDTLPKNTPVTVGINMAYSGSDYMQEVVNQASAAMNMSNVNVVGLEMGNEPDLYLEAGYRQSGWSTTDYGNEWLTRVEAVYNATLKSHNIGTAFFEAPCTATTAVHNDYRISNLVNTAVASGSGIWVAGWSQHDYYYYVNVSSYTLTLDLLLNLGTTESQFNEWTKQAQQAAVTGKPYYLREMGSVGPEGIKGISDTFGNTLWTFNFFLFAATVNVASVQMHMTDNSYSAPWEPNESTDSSGNTRAPFVRSSYAAYAAINQVIGAKCATSVAPLSISNPPSGYSNNMRAYSIYDGNDLSGVALFNTKVVYSSNGGATTQNFQLSMPSAAGQTVYISTLNADYTDSTQGTTWNGVSYETSNGKPAVTDSANHTAVVGSDGSVTIPVRDSQAVVVNIGSKLGTTNNVVDQKVCNNLASTTSEGGASSTTGSKGTAPTFKSTSGFASNMPLSLGAIIGIAAGGGAAILIVLALCIYCCVRRNRRKRRAAYAARAGSSSGGDRKAHYESVETHDPSGGDIFMRPMDRHGRPIYDNAAVFKDGATRSKGGAGAGAAGAGAAGAAAGAAAARNQGRRGGDQRNSRQPPPPQSRSQSRQQYYNNNRASTRNSSQPPLPVPPAMSAADAQYHDSPGRQSYRGSGVPSQQIDPQGYYYDDPSWNTPKSGSFPTSQRHSYEVGQQNLPASDSMGSSEGFQRHSHPRYDSTSSSLHNKQQY